MARMPFEIWAPSEISRLRGEADALERALKIFVSSQDVFGSDTSKAAPSPDGRRGPRISKYEPAFQAFEKEARVLSHQDMIDIAKALGFEIDRANMRSLVYAQKIAGRVTEIGGNYFWGDQPKPEPELKSSHPPVTEEDDDL